MLCCVLPASLCRLLAGARAKAHTSHKGRAAASFFSIPFFSPFCLFSPFLCAKLPSASARRGKAKQHTLHAQTHAHRYTDKDHTHKTTTQKLLSASLMQKQHTCAETMVFIHVLLLSPPPLLSNPHTQDCAALSAFLLWRPFGALWAKPLFWCSVIMSPREVMHTHAC